MKNEETVKKQEDKYRDLIVYTTKNIIDKKEKIFVVYHDEDGEWQAFGKSQDIDDAAMVSMSDLLKLDSTIEEVLDMPSGYVAFRKKNLLGNIKWRILKNEE